MTTDLGIGNIMLSIFFLLTNRFSRYLLSEETPNGLDTLKFQCETIISIQQRDVVCVYRVKTFFIVVSSQDLRLIFTFLDFFFWNLNHCYELII